MVVDTFIATAHRIVWCSVATVDRRGRPRTRILPPYWEPAVEGLRGWVVTRRSPLKTAHLARTPYVSCSYWDATHDVAIADCHADWEEDAEEAARVWALYAGAPGAALLCLDPWRLHVADAMTVATPRVWKADTAYR